MFCIGYTCIRLKNASEMKEKQQQQNTLPSCLPEHSRANSVERLNWFIFTKEKTLKELFSLSGPIVLSDNRSTSWHDPVTISSHIYDVISYLLSYLLPTLGPSRPHDSPGLESFGLSRAQDLQLCWLNCKPLPMSILVLSSINANSLLLLESAHQMKLVGRSFRTAEYCISISTRNTCLLL